MRCARQAAEAGLLSDEHFTVDGTLLEAWASLKSFRRKDAGPTPPPDDPGNPTVNFHGESRRNDTHQSTTDPDAQLARKGPGKEAKLSYAGHVLLDNRHGLVANVCVTRRDGHGRTRGRGAAAGRACRTAAPSAATRASMCASFVAGGARARGHAARRAEGQGQRH